MSRRRVRAAIIVLLCGLLFVALLQLWPLIVYREDPVLMTGFRAEIQALFEKRGRMRVDEETFVGVTVVGRHRVHRFSEETAGAYCLWYVDSGFKAIEARTIDGLVTIAIWDEDGTLVGGTMGVAAPWGEDQQSPSAPWVGGDRSLLDWLAKQPEARPGAKLPITHRTHLRPF